MENTQILPYRVRVQFVIIMDTLTHYSDNTKTHTQVVTAENGKAYNIISPFAPRKENSNGVVRSSLKEAIQRIARNAYNDSKMLLIGNNKLAKNTNALAGFVEPLVKEVAGAFPFPQDFHLFKEDVTIVVEAVDGETVEGQSTVKGIDMRFSDFVKVDGWPEVDSTSNFAEIRLTVALKIACGEMSNEDHVALLEKFGSLSEKVKDFYVAYLMNSEADQSLASHLMNRGAKIVTRNTALNHMTWFPASRTAMDEKVFRSLQGDFADFILVK